MKTTTCLFSVAILTLTGLAYGGNSIPHYVIGHSGGRATSANHTVISTIGQPVTGTAVSANHLIVSGFWAAALPHCSLPADVNLDVKRNGVDVQGFVGCFLGNGSNCDCADMNADGLVNSVDVPLFVTALLTAP